MALNKSDLKNAIITLMEDMLEREDTSIEEFATRLSDAVDGFVKTADVIYTGGLTAGGDPVVGGFEGRIE